MEDELIKVAECINRGRNYFNYMIFYWKNKEINNSNYTKIYIDTLCSFIEGYGFKVSPIYRSLSNIDCTLLIYGEFYRYIYINESTHHKLYVLPYENEQIKHYKYSVASYEKYIKEKDLDKNKG